MPLTLAWFIGNRQVADDDLGGHDVAARAKAFATSNVDGWVIFCGECGEQFAVGEK